MKLEKGSIFTAQIGSELICYRVKQFNGPGWLDHGQVTLSIVWKKLLETPCDKCKGAGVIMPKIPPEDTESDDPEPEAGEGETG